MMNREFMKPAQATWRYGRVDSSTILQSSEVNTFKEERQ